MTAAVSWRSTVCGAALLALLVWSACGSAADGPASGTRDDAMNRNAADVSAPQPDDTDEAGAMDDEALSGAIRASAPAFLEDETEVEMQSLSTEAFRPAEASECGLPAVDAGGGILVYFGCTPESGPILRAVPARRVAGREPEAALAALLDGPTEAERSRGFLSSFGPETANVEWTTGVEDGVAWVDFDPAILEVDGLFVTPMDAAQIVATLGQFEGIDRVLLLVGGEPLCRAQGEC